MDGLVEFQKRLGRDDRRIGICFLRNLEECTLEAINKRTNSNAVALGNTLDLDGFCPKCHMHTAN